MLYYMICRKNSRGITGKKEGIKYIKELMMMWMMGKFGLGRIENKVRAIMIKLTLMYC